LIYENRFIAVLRGKTAADAIENGEQLLRAGIRLLEITFTAIGSGLKEVISNLYK